MIKYMTKQRQILLEFLARHIDESFSAKQIAAALSDQNISISAVYRNLADLEAEEKIQRVVRGRCREVLYQYIDPDRCGEYLHLSCRDCGRTYHMNVADADHLISKVAQREKFAVDRQKTVLYGLCENCQKH